MVPFYVKCPKKVNQEKIGYWLPGAKRREEWGVSVNG